MPWFHAKAAQEQLRRLQEATSVDGVMMQKSMVFGRIIPCTLQDGPLQVRNGVTV